MLVGTASAELTAARIETVVNFIVQMLLNLRRGRGFDEERRETMGIRSECWDEGDIYMLYTTVAVLCISY